MKKNLILICLFFASSYISAQISIMEVKEKEPQKNTSSYDSLSNVKNYPYEHLVGQELLFMGNQNASLYAKFRYFDNFWEECKRDFSGQYFKLIGIEKKRILNRGTLPFWIMEHTDTGEKFYVELDRVVHQENVANRDNKEWLVVGHYEKIKQLYLNKDFVLVNNVEEDYTHDGFFIYGSNTPVQKLPGKLRTIWKCTEVSAKKTADKKRCSPIVLVFENPEHCKYYIYNEQMDFGWERRGGYADNLFSKTYIKKYGSPKLALERFIEKNEYDRIYELDKNIRSTQAKIAAKKREAESKLRNERNEQRKKELIGKYGEENGVRVYNGQIFLGMTKQMCIDAKGNPQKINKTTTIYGTSEQWVYYGLYLYFENGILTTIQD